MILPSGARNSLLICLVILTLGAGSALAAPTLSVRPADPPVADDFVIVLHDIVNSGASWTQTNFSVVGNVITIEHLCDVSNLPTISEFDDEIPMTGMLQSSYTVLWTVTYEYAGTFTDRSMTLTFDMPVTELISASNPIPALGSVGWTLLGALLLATGLWMRRRQMRAAAE